MAAGVEVKVTWEAPAWLRSPEGARRVYDRVLDFTERVMEKHATQIVPAAAQKLDSAVTGGSGALKDTLDQDTFREGETVVTEFSAGKQYDLVLEYGPDVESWTIEAKFAKALVFPILTDTGAVESFRTIPRGKSVLHVWDESHLRPHWVPAIEEAWPEIEKDLSEVPRKAVESL